jgi:hypothetical protein
MLSQQMLVAKLLPDERLAGQDAQMQKAIEIVTGM